VMLLVVLASPLRSMPSDLTQALRRAQQSRRSSSVYWAFFRCRKSPAVWGREAKPLKRQHDFMKANATDGATVRRLWKSDGKALSAIGKGHGQGLDRSSPTLW